jgi:iodotyrosine deiodinase
LAADPTIPTVSLSFLRRPVAESRARAEAFLSEISARRSVREFSPEPVPTDVLERCIAAAAQAPSGANKQPWRFVLVTDPGRKRAIREAAEAEERSFYRERAPRRWLDDLAALGTDEHKEFLEVAPALIAVFAERSGPDGERHYYVSESVGIAVGFLIAALHHAGLATLTHTPSPMKFLRELLGRPANERAYVLLPVGYPAPGCRVPAIDRKSIDEILVRDGGGRGNRG